MEITLRLVSTSLLSFVTACLVSASALAQVTPTFQLDGFSAFVFEGAGKSALIPPANIPMEISPRGNGQWEVRIRSSALFFPPITYPSGRVVEWRLSADAIGIISRTESGAVFQITAPAVAHVDGNSSGIPMTLTFSTETLTATAKEVTAQRQGVRLDRESGYLQLVAANVNPIHAATAPGHPFYAILSGRILGFRLP